MTDSDRRRRSLFWGVAAVVAIVMVPAVVNGAPLADDFNNCLSPQQQGLGGFLADSWERLGVIRAARFIEILLTTGVCDTLPFGVAIAVSASLFLGVGLALRALLNDMGIADPWSDVGGALWLLQPLGTEISLWPAALHVPLGLLFALLSLIAFRRGRWALGAIGAAVACLSVEQVLPALPLAAWLTTAADSRRKALFVASGVVVAAVVAFALFPGNDPRLEAGVGERLRALVSDPGFYVGYPAVGLGLHSIPLAVKWALPWSAAIAAAGVLAGYRLLVPTLRKVAARKVSWRDGVLAFSALVVLINVPVILNVPRQGSPRIFAPTWLVLSAAVAIAGSAIAGRGRETSRRVIAGVAGGLVAGMLLSIAFSVSVRLDSARFVNSASERITSRTENGDLVGICGVRRTVVDPAPRGAFAVHDFVYDWAAQDAVRYYTGRRVTFLLGGETLGSPCPREDAVDVRFDFDRLLSDWAGQ